jgi:hypothetical protein
MVPAYRDNGEGLKIVLPPVLVSISHSRNHIMVGKGAAMYVVLIYNWLADSPVGGTVKKISFPLVFGSRV